MEDSVVLATKIINSIDDLPLKLNFIFDLGNKISEYINADITLSNELSLVKGLNLSADDFKLVHPNKIKNQLIETFNNQMSIPLIPKFEDENLYLLINLNGYISNWRETNTSFYVKNQFKSLLGLMISNDILNFSYKKEMIFSSVYYIFKEKGILSQERLNDDFYKQVDRLALNVGLSGIIDSNRIKNTLDLSMKLFQDNEECKKLRNAFCWLFDSYVGNNELLSFVQATITLEIVLGDKNESDKVGIGVLLKNRCAYLLGKTSKERKKL